MDFKDASLKTKKRRSEELKDGRDLNEILLAAAIALEEEGRPLDAQIVRNMMATDKDDDSKCLSADKALSVLMDTGMSKQDYQTVRLTVKEYTGMNTFPAYNHVREAKEKCIPEGIVVDDYSASVDLQQLVDHTVNRLYEAHPQLFSDVKPGSVLTLVSKVGFDGSTGQSIYKQGVESDGRMNMSVEESLFMSCLVPVRILEGDKVIWSNPKPSSPLYCRPIQFKVNVHFFI